MVRLHRVVQQRIPVTLDGSDVPDRTIAAIQDAAETTRDGTQEADQVIGSCGSVHGWIPCLGKVLDYTVPGLCLVQNLRTHNCVPWTNVNFNYGC